MPENILKAAILGSGPSGFFAAEELLNQTAPKISVDMFDRLPTPFGLVRGGVAPDHEKIKTVTKVFEKTAAREGFRFFGNVEFGRDLQLGDLQKFYDVILFAVGAKSDRKMNIPGEDLEGSFPATEFVGWYNGHPDYRNLKFDLSCERAAVIGNGNVAVDVTRILARDPRTLKSTDIADYALQALKESRIKEIYMIGRRGAVQAAFTNPEARELCDLPGADLIVDPKELELDELSKASLESGEGGSKPKNNLNILMEHSMKQPSGNPRKIVLKFLGSPKEILGKSGKAAALKLEKNRLVKDAQGNIAAEGTGEFETLPVGLIFRSIGYRGTRLPGIPYDEKKGTIPNLEGRVIDPQFKQIPGIYVVGWAKRGPSGVIGTNKPDSIDTVHKVLEDWRDGKVPFRESDLSTIPKWLESKGIQYITFEDWKKLDAIEITNGKADGKTRKKFTNIPSMLEALNK